jgi:poly(glycerol-phosphate) alpha-glucosyltransferase
MLTGALSREGGGGVLEALRGLSLALLNHFDVDVRLFGMDDGLLEQEWAAWNGLPIKVVRRTWPRQFWYGPGLVAALLAADLDLLHTACSWLYPTVAALRWRRATGRCVIASLNGNLDPWAIANAGWKKKIAGLLFENQHLRGAACLHALNRSEAESFRAYGLTNPICIIPNGVELPGPAPGIAPPWAHTVPASDGVLLFLGRLHPKKNIAALIEAWHMNADSLPAAQHWWLVIAGWNQLGYEESLRDMVTQRTTPRVLFVGPQFGEDKASCLARATAFALPSLSEGLPMAVLEAMSWRLPVLMTSACNLPEAFDAGAAISVEASPSAIANGLVRLFAMSKCELVGMGELGRRMVEARFTWKAIAREMLQVYRAVRSDQPVGGRNDLSSMI